MATRAFYEAEIIISARAAADEMRKTRPEQTAGVGAAQLRGWFIDASIIHFEMLMGDGSADRMQEATAHVLAKVRTPKYWSYLASVGRIVNELQLHEENSK